MKTTDSSPNRSTTMDRRTALRGLGTIGLVMLSGCNANSATSDRTDRDAILVVIALDRNYYIEAGRVVPVDPAAALEGLVANMREIDTSACPTEFRKAYEAHVTAWTRVADDVASRPDYAETYRVQQCPMGHLSVVDADAPHEFDELRNMEPTASELAKVSQTWQRVLEIAAKHGAAPAEHGA